MKRCRGSENSNTDWQRASRWSPTTAAAALAALRESGETVAAFASRHGIDPYRLYDWRRRLQREEAPPTSFVEVVARPAAIPETCVFEVVVANGAVVRVPSSFDDAGLRRLLAIVGGGC